MSQSRVYCVPAVLTVVCVGSGGLTYIAERKSTSGFVGTDASHVTDAITCCLHAYLPLPAHLLTYPGQPIEPWQPPPPYVNFLPARRYASAGYSDRNVSVRLSVCLSVTRRYCVKTKKASVMISSPSGSPKTLVF